MSDINAGDVVRLKSGGQTMTVEWIDPETRTASCVWFDEKNQNHRASFSLAALEK